MKITKNLNNKAILTLLLIFASFLITLMHFSVNAQVLTNNAKGNAKNYNWVYDGQKYYDINGKEIAFDKNLPQECKTNSEKKECLNFAWVIFTTKKESVKENKPGFRNIYSDTIYSTLEEAKNDKQMKLILENSKKRLTLEDKIKKELEKSKNYQNNFFVNIILTFIFGFIVLISALVYFWVHNKHIIIKTNNKIKLEIFYPKEKTSN